MVSQANTEHRFFYSLLLEFFYYKKILLSLSVNPCCTDAATKTGGALLKKKKEREGKSKRNSTCKQQFCPSGLKTNSEIHHTAVASVFVCFCAEKPES